MHSILKDIDYMTNSTVAETAYDFRYELRLDHGKDDVIRIVTTTLLGLGFSILESSTEVLRAVGPGMRSTNQPGLLCMSSIEIKIDQDHLSVLVEFGSLRKLLNAALAVEFILGIMMPILVFLLGGGVFWLLMITPIGLSIGSIFIRRSQLLRAKTSVINSVTGASRASVT